MGINSVFQSLEIREEIWTLFATAKLPIDAIAHEIALEDALDVAPRVLAGLTRGRVVVSVQD